MATDALQTHTDTPSDFTYSYEFGVAINVGTAEERKWLPVRFISSVDPSRSPKTKDAATYDDRGADNSPVVGESWSLSFYVQGHRTSTGKYLAEVEKLLELATPTAVGANASGEFLWFDKPASTSAKANPAEAFMGIGTVDLKRADTSNDGIGGFNVTITGLGPRTQVKNPYNPATGALEFTQTPGG